MVGRSSEPSSRSGVNAGATRPRSLSAAVGMVWRRGLSAAGAAGDAGAGDVGAEGLVAADLLVPPAEGGVAFLAGVGRAEDAAQALPRGLVQAGLELLEWGRLALVFRRRIFGRLGLRGAGMSARPSQLRAVADDRAGRRGGRAGADGRRARRVRRAAGLRPAFL